jgi:Uma2 family endonuclease
MDDGNMAPVKVVQPRVSYADLQQTPEDGRRYELYDGEVFVVPAPTPLHQLAIHEFGDLLKAYAKKHGGRVFLSPIDVVFSDFNVLQPDLVFFVNGREHLIDLRQAIRIVPDLAIEVVSPSSVRTDRGRKMQAFARYGVREYWMLDPETRSVEVYGLAEAGYLLTETVAGAGAAHSTILPGFSAPLDVLFDR